MKGSYPSDPRLSALAGKRVYIETYGCRYNFGDTAKLEEILRYQECILTKSENDADAVIVNTCTVVAPTERRMLRRLFELRDHNLHVTGCMPEIQREAILAVCTPLFIPHSLIHEEYRHIGTVAAVPVGIVQVARGCQGGCTYCITRKSRGELASIPLPEILRQIREYSNKGSVEIQLTAQDVSAWGRDIGETLPGLLQSIGDLEGNFYIRVGMMNPATVIDILDDLVDAFSCNNLFRFIHIPAQSGSDRILSRMGRQYRVEDMERIVYAFRKRYPDITIATDMIVGFPGETEDDFFRSVDLIRQLDFLKVNITRYSRRPMTPAYSFADMPDRIKKDRSRVLQSCAEEIYHRKYSRFLGRTLPFIVTEQIKAGSVMGRTSAYTGIVLKEELPIGFTGSAKILGHNKYFLTGLRTGDPEGVKIMSEQ